MISTAPYSILKSLESQKPIRKSISCLGNDMKNKDGTHEIALQRLRPAGADHVADTLASFQSVDGDLKGWDGHARREFQQALSGLKRANP